ncbi:hypothetical protein ZIOFF_011634 [Zingiber officinale]|uniref:Uncharacterized protein n=1 Tax=Zingiber officinale TaxID=94328 RepID=A0A8J5HMC6_ZINOF|nr:hypothetical protein ZIOFF_011634 [Zingiber officinale]
MTPMMASSSFLAPPLPLLSSLRQPQIHPRCDSLCPSSLTATLPPPPGSPRCNSYSRATYASEEERNKKLLESYGLDPSDFLSRSDNEPRRRRRSDQGEEVGKGKHVPLFQESKPPLRTTHKLLQVLNKLAHPFNMFLYFTLKKLLLLKLSIYDGVRDSLSLIDGSIVALLDSFESMTGERSPIQVSLGDMQVLGGKACRKKLLSPKGMDVRPMMEVVKGAAFGILQVAGGCPASLRPGRWLDLYSGTGAVGIEAISRGCSEAHFVEMDPWVVSKVLQPNLESTGFSDVSVIHTVRVERFLEQAEQSLDNNRTFDYISVTPPYTEVDYSVLMDQLAKSPLVGEDCFILVEYPLKTSMADSCGHLIKISDRRFGRTNLVIYGPSWAEKKRTSRKHIQ